MKKNIGLSKAFSLFILLVVSLGVSAQNFKLSLQNDVQTSEKSLEFDLVIQNTFPAVPFELSGVQAGILVNSQIENGGVLTATIVAGSSQLVESQKPQTILYSQSEHCIKIAAQIPPSQGQGTVVATTEQGTKICRIRLTSTEPFLSGSKTDLKFSFSVSPYPTKVSSYAESKPVILSTDPGNCVSLIANKLLNSSNGLFFAGNRNVLYPNPAVDGFVVNTGDSNEEIGVYNASGICMLTQAGAGNVYVDVRSLKPGVYEVRVKNQSIKLIKQ